MLPNYTKREEGFTLIELLVVIIIIGILAAIAIPLFLDQRKLAVDASVKSDVRNTLANIKTWQANDANANKAVANTGDFISATNNGKVAQSPGNSIGISISSTGDATVCGYNGSGKTYLSDSAAYVFSPATGQFTTGSCASGSTTGGTAATGGTASTSVANLTFETNDPYRTSWYDYDGASVPSSSYGASYLDTANAHGGSGYALRVPYNGTQRFLSYYPLVANGYTVGQKYNVTAWVYFTSSNSAAQLLFDAKGVNQATTNTVTRGQWVQLTNSFTYASGNTGPQYANSKNFIRFYANVSDAVIYVDDIVITPAP